MPRARSMHKWLTGPAGVLAIVVGLGISPLDAQEARQHHPTEPLAVTAPLPEPRSTRHTLELLNRTLHFTATVGAIPIRGAGGTILADVAYTAYTLDATRSPQRPLTFAFNGGPGAASTWLHLGTMGPWRVPLDAATIAAGTKAPLEPNNETWLDFADLVFLDPPGTGYSRIWPHGAEAARQEGAQERSEKGGRAWFWSIRGDIATFAEVIKTWTRQADRLENPIVLVGESYGGFRAPLIAETLLRDHAMAVRSLVLVSPVLDFDGRRGGHLPMHSVALLPSLAATRLERTGMEPNRATLAGVETYARGDYLLDLVRGPRDVAAQARLAEAVAGFTGLLPEQVRAQSGRVSGPSFVRGNPLFGNSAVSLYDAGMSELPAPPAGRRSGTADPFTSGLSAPLSAAVARLHARFGWTTERPYLTLASEVTQNWVWQRGPNPPEALSALQTLMQSDQRRTTLVTHGFTDLVTPYFASAVQLDLLPSHGRLPRIHLEVYPGGHMFYSRDASRARFRADAERTITSAIQPNPAHPGPHRETP